MKILISDFIKRYRWFLILLLPVASLINLPTFGAEMDGFLLVILSPMAGALILIMENHNGHLKTLRQFPLTTKQIAMSYWTIGIVLFPLAITFLTLVEYDVILCFGANTVDVPNRLFWSCLWGVSVAGYYLLLASVQPNNPIPEGFWEKLHAQVWGVACSLFGLSPFILMSWQETVGSAPTGFRLVVFFFGLCCAVLSYYCLFRYKLQGGEPRAGFLKLLGLEARQPRIREKKPVQFSRLRRPLLFGWMRSFSYTMLTIMLIGFFYFVMVFIQSGGDPNNLESLKKPDCSLLMGIMVGMAVGGSMRWQMALRPLRLLPLSQGRLSAWLWLHNLFEFAGCLVSVSAVLLIFWGTAEPLKILLPYFPLIVGFSVFTSTLILRFGRMRVILGLVLVSFILGFVLFSYLLIPLIRFSNLGEDLEIRTIKIPNDGVFALVGCLLIVWGAVWHYRLIGGHSRAYQAGALGKWTRPGGFMGG